jgi:uncharacterized membrane protein YgdD (TMEM256/DUF423 family)
MQRPFLVLGAVNGFLAVALGAFGAHGLRARVGPGLLEIWQTAVLYHMVHALGLVLIGVAAALLPDSRTLRTAGWLMAAGVLVFSGTLYLLVGTGTRWLGAVTPFGGTALLLAWALFAWAAWQGPRPSAAD